MSAELGSLQARSFARASAATVSAFPLEHRLTGQQLAAYLDRRAFAVIGSSRPDGRPHAAVGSYLRRGTDFWLPTVAGAVRARNVRHQPWLTLTVTEGDHRGHVVVLIEGPADLIPPGRVPGDLRAAFDQDWVGVWVRLTAARLLSYASNDAAV